MLIITNLLATTKIIRTSLTSTPSTARSLAWELVSWLRLRLRWRTHSQTCLLPVLRYFAKLFAWAFWSMRCRRTCSLMTGARQAHPILGRTCCRMSLQRRSGKSSTPCMQKR